MSGRASDATRAGSGPLEVSFTFQPRNGRNNGYRPPTDMFEGMFNFSFCPYLLQTYSRAAWKNPFAGCFISLV